MTADEQLKVDQVVRESRRAVEDARQERKRIDETLEQSRRVRREALPVLRRAGYVR